MSATFAASLVGGRTINAAASARVPRRGSPSTAPRAARRRSGIVVRVRTGIDGIRKSQFLSIRKKRKRRFFPSISLTSDPFFPFPPQNSKLKTQQADLTQQAALAVSQQSVAYAVAILGENLYQRALLVEGAGGRPALPLTLAGAGSAVASAVLVSSGGPGATLGIVVGAVGALGTLMVSVDRVRNVKGDPFVSFGVSSFSSFSLFSLFSLFSFSLNLLLFLSFKIKTNKQNTLLGLARPEVVARVHGNRELRDDRWVRAGVCVRGAVGMKEGGRRKERE